MRANHLCALLAVSLLAVPRLEAAEAYVLNFWSETPINPGSCVRIQWTSDVIFHNSNSEDSLIKVLGLSNGASHGPTTELLIPAGRTRSATYTGIWGAGPNGDPGSPRLWVARIDVPEGVTVQNRAEGSFFLCSQGLPFGPAEFGAFSLPVVRTLVPANAAKIHLGVDLGAEHSYVNVGIYNAAGDEARASVELRQGCDDTVLARQTVTIPGNSVVQLGGLDGPGNGCYIPGPGNTNGWVRYVVVKVDRPSFSYAVSKMYELPFPLRIPYGSTSSP